jgi:predicted DNA-binding transcriptional regulator YafY
MAQVHYLLRNVLIINKIKCEPYIGLSDLTNHVRDILFFRGIQDAGVSQRTIQRDIQNIQTDFGIDIQYSRAQHGYNIGYSPVSDVIECFLDSFEVLIALNAEAGNMDFIFAEKHRNTGIQHLHLLIYAIKNNVRITFLYAKFQNDSQSERCIEPYALKEFRGRWYLLGRSAGQQDMKSYGLDRIENLVVTEERFKRDTSVDIAEKFRYSFGIYSSDEYPVEEVVLSFDAEDGKYIKSSPIHHSQEIIKDAEDEFVIQLRLKITLDFVMEIISRSWSLKVIQPDSLREKVSKIYKAAIERNR